MSTRPVMGFESEDAPEHPEGAYDAQLALPGLLSAGRGPIQELLKRDGRLVTFEQRQLEESLFRAAQAAGGADRERARSLAAAVTIYLSKSRGDDPVTADEVCAAVERVLVEMGHSRVALAYARYREQEARLRRIRTASPAEFRRMAHAPRREASGPQATPLPGLFVRTGAETLAEWNRERIVDALLRETGLGEPLAELIAGEVEQQVMRAGVRTVTASLIRELVDARLVEHGLEEHRRRHMRLGVPLFDAERIICLPAHDAPDMPADPVLTDQLLAERVKREFALNHVFSDRVSEAHLAGDLHLVQLGRVDRAERLAANASDIVQWGLGLAFPSLPNHLPTEPETLVQHILLHTERMRAHASRELLWRWLNTGVAPFFKKWSLEDTEQLAAELLSGLASADETAPPASLELAWDTPAALRTVAALGPGGATLPDTCERWTPQARTFALACIGALPAVANVWGSRAAPRLCVAVHAAGIEAPEARPLWERVLEALEQGVPIDLELIPEPDAEPADLPDLALQSVQINLPRLAYWSMSEDALLSEVGRLLELAAQAHKERYVFADKLMAMRDGGPWAFLAQERSGRPLYRLDAAACLIELPGLAECVQYLCGSSPHSSEEALSTARRILHTVRAACASLREKTGINILLAGSADREGRRRLAMLDLQQYSEAAEQVLTTAPGGAAPAYSAGPQGAWVETQRGTSCVVLDAVLQAEVDISAPSPVSAQVWADDAADLPQHLTGIARQLKAPHRVRIIPAG